jgi:hypothetical protein
VERQPEQSLPLYTASQVEPSKVLLSVQLPALFPERLLVLFRTACLQAVGMEQDKLQLTVQHLASCLAQLLVQ